MKIYNTFSMLCFNISRKVKVQLKCKKKICAVYGEGAVTDQTCQKWFVKFLGTVDISAKQFFAVSCLTHWKMFGCTPGLYPLEANSRRQPTYSKYPNQ